jgi:uncharacterized protein YbjT (DUF2867 family)
MKPIIAVTGATGAQGGGLVRAITRNPDSDSAKALAAQGCEVVRADLDDVDSLRAAFAGAYGAFCVTNFWEHFSAPRETQQANNLAQAAKDAGVKHVVWSTLEDTRRAIPLDDDRMPTLHGHYKVPHFDGKGEADATFTALGVPTTFLRTSFYWDNIATVMPPRPGPDGGLTFVLPMGDKLLSGIAAADIGAVAFGIFKRPDLIGKVVGIAGEHLTVQQMVDAMTRHLGQPVTYVPVPPSVYRGFGFPGADDLGNMFQYYAETEAAFVALRDVAFARELHPGLLTFDQWLTQNAARIPV